VTVCINFQESEEKLDVHSAYKIRGNWKALHKQLVCMWIVILTFYKRGSGWCSPCVW